MSVQLADSHLTYIGARSRPGTSELARYDVYPRRGGLQLGWVVRYRHEWVAISDDPAVDNVPGRTRWEAATAMWGSV